jgi:vacuolar-type H+-ATPase subunit E/Vma4
MGLEKLTAEVARKGQQEASLILERAKAESSGIIDNAISEARAGVEIAKTQAQLAASRESSEELSHAKTNASRILVQARSDVVDRYLEAVWSKVLDYRQTDEYAALINSQIRESVKEIGPNCRFFIRREDVGLLGKVQPEGFIDCAGGLLAKDASGRVIMDGRLETLFAEHRERLSSLVHSRVFPEKR